MSLSLSDGFLSLYYVLNSLLGEEHHGLLHPSHCVPRHAVVTVLTLTDGDLLLYCCLLDVLNSLLGEDHLGVLHPSHGVPQHDVADGVNLLLVVHSEVNCTEKKSETNE